MTHRSTARYLIQRLPICIAFGACAAFMSCASLAQQQARPAYFGLGLGVATAERPYDGVGPKTLPIPVIAYDGQYARIAGAGVDLKLGAPGNWDFAVRSSYNLGTGYKKSDSYALRGMEKRKAGLWLGGVVTYKSNFARVSMEVLKDASSQSKGTQANVMFSRDIRTDSFIFTPRVGLQHVDKNYSNYYYGVKRSEATAGRASYRADASENVLVGVRAAYVINSEQTVFLDVSATVLGREIKESPIVDKRTLPAATIGYLYSF